MRFAPHAKTLLKRVATYADFAFPLEHILHCRNSRQGIKNHRSETARRTNRDLRAIIIYGAFCVSGFNVCFLAGQQAFGQIPTADIVGTVRDATGPVMMNATVQSQIRRLVICAGSYPALMAVLCLTSCY